MRDELLNIITDFLYKIFYENGYSSALFSENKKFNSLDIAKQKFVRNVVLGVVEKKIAFEYVLEVFKIKVKRKIKIILFIGFYVSNYMNSKDRGVFLNRLIEYSKVNYSYSYKFINYIFRNVDVKKILNDENLKDNIKFSVNKDTFELLKSQYEIEKLERIFLSNNNDIHLRINTKYFTKKEVLKELNSEILVKENKILKDFIDIINLNGFKINELSAYKKGMFYVQDISSGFVFESIKDDLDINMKVLDLCSSPGGKSTYFAQYLQDFSVVSCDILENKLKIIKENANRLNLKLKIIQNDATKFNKNLGKFDIVLVDAPCSAMGLIMKKPEIRIKDFDFDEIYKLQSKIIDISSNYVKENGFLIYSTCSINKNENEKIIEKFLKNNINFEKMKINIIENKLNNELNYDILLLPSNFTDGFYISKLKKVRKK